MSLAQTSPGLGQPRLGSGQSASGNALHVPASLQRQLLDFRRRVWTIKMIEAVAIAVFALCVAFLAIYAMDRFGDTPAPLRAAVLVAVIAVAAVVPLYLYRWVWRQSGLEQLARLLGRRLPSVGDQLLGVIELTHSNSEQARSPALCQAAMRQVASDAKQRNFLDAVPPSRHRAWAGAASVVFAIALLLAVLYPAASANALARFAAPWSDIPRYTFTVVETLPEQVVVAHGESSTLSVALAEQSRWQPSEGEISLGRQQPLKARLAEGRYVFSLPPQIEPQEMIVHIGDATQRVRLEPTLRPELSSLVAEVALPEYLQRPIPFEVDSRGGTVSLVRGSGADFTATANRPLLSGTVNGEPRQPNGAELGSGAIAVDESRTLEFQWKDEYGLAGREPFTLSINAIEDEAPTLICDGLPRQAVLLDSEVVNFKVRASDDFGIRRVGLLWRGLPNSVISQPAEGERVLSAGGPEQDVLDVLGTFSATSLNIEPQPIELFVWAEDYLSERPRVLSPPYTLYILTPDQHAIWITEQLSKWHRQALDVRDRELQLYETNKELRNLSPEDLDSPDVRRQLERQASAERANGSRLAKLSDVGGELIRTASRNPEIGVGHLERWAEMLQVLGDISANRMPSVADLLKEAADQPKIAAGGSSGRPKSMAGQVRAAGAGTPSEPSDAPQPQTPAPPQLVDIESSQNSPNDDAAEPAPPKKPGSSPLRLPVTTVMGKGGKGGDPPPANQDEAMEEAVTEQEDLLAEFERIADELNTILANLEGSTLVKRLKAASRDQYLIAGRLTEQLQPAFGTRTPRLDPDVREVFTELVAKETESTQEISYIMDDIAAYFERRRFMQFKTVLEDMKESDVIGGLRQLTVEIPEQQGMSIAQCEYWSDALDRWAEDLVDPACSGTCPGGKSPASLPPSIVLEVLQILEAEVNLREETRVAEQAKGAQDDETYGSEAERLSGSQAELGERVEKVIGRIKELPDSERHFAKELALLAQVEEVMGDATRILARPDTGASAIAAETEAIELLLQSKRINPKGGGGGGSSPGGGGGGTTVDSALALVGAGMNQKEVREDRGVTQTTGEAGASLPEEFRVGLDEYFNRLGQPN